MAESALRRFLPSARDRILSQQGQMPIAPMPQETFRGQAFNTMYDMFGGSSEDPARRAQATRRAEGLIGAGRFAADFTPIVSDAIAIDEVRDAYRQGNYGTAAILGGATMLGMLPVAGDAASKAIRSVVNTDYRGSHQPPTRDYGAPLNDLTMLIPEDVYSAAGPRLYGIGNPEVDREAFRSLRDARGKPEAEVTVYRAVPENVSAINEGDWVTTSKRYAEMHGESALGGNYKIIEQKAKAKDLFSEGYPYEFGYSPLDMSTDARMQTEYELAHEVAQRNAALPVEQGGLGLPPNNTAMDRANAPGMFPDDAYHFSRHGADVQELDSGKYAIAPFDAVGTHVGSKEQAFDRFENTVGYKVNNPMYANDDLRGVTYPLRVNTGNRMLSPSGLVMSETPISMGFSASADYGNLKTSNEALRESIFPKYDSIPYINEVESPGQISYILPPKNIRSRFAAFDPAKRDSANLLAGAAGVTFGLSALRNIQREDEQSRID